MKFSSWISFIGIMVGTTSAEITIKIDDQKIKSTVGELQQWDQQHEQLPQWQQYNEAMHNARERVKMDAYTSAQKVFKPVLKDIDNYLEYFTPGSNCDKAGLEQCIMRQFEEGHDVNLYQQSCDIQNSCQPEWDDLTYQQKMHLEKKYGKNKSELRLALRDMIVKMQQDIQTAKREQAANKAIIDQQSHQEITTIFNQWGCNQQCVANTYSAATDWNPVEVVKRCQCPSPVKVTHTENVEINNQGTDLVEVAVREGGYKFSIVCIFIIQILWCIGYQCFHKKEMKQIEKDHKKRAIEYNEFFVKYQQKVDQDKASLKEYLLNKQDEDNV